MKYGEKPSASKCYTPLSGAKSRALRRPWHFLGALTGSLAYCYVKDGSCKECRFKKESKLGAFTFRFSMRRRAKESTKTMPE